ncbi:GNAT family N-acetyltransferase [Peptostreptococcus equinus]|uniref:GNAT family protein n=1 Tax=Peptostreptococcus equinus TaxID=3003601 RepID=A0ABY7JP89_9FIRM|nr:GNAT family protein [Peptostreptococcus sp. CBA3647]WAW15162.1 GNAT family protein [Peptostreptococcus sp. CBA3647]
MSYKHFDDLFSVYSSLTSDDSFTYMVFDKFEKVECFKLFFENMIKSIDPYYLAIIDNKSKKAIGSFALMRIDKNNRVIEIGSILYSDILKKSKMATEAQYLIMKYVFEDIKYRRYEWKCDNYNEPSKRAAKRLGFKYEGLFRKAMVYKGRNRDTAWFSIIDDEWKLLKNKFEAWLEDSNFDKEGKQIKALNEL